MASANYEKVGRHYKEFRKPDQRIEMAIFSQLSDSNSIINVGAGAGSYEPEGKSITAVEPSATMLRQREQKLNTQVVRAYAESLPFKENTFDSATAILTVHHWNDWQIGLKEVYRVIRNKVVLLTWIGMPNGFWLYDYFPEIRDVDKGLFPSVDQLQAALGNLEVIAVPIPKDCSDGFLCAYWARPEMYLDARVRSVISTFTRITDKVAIERGVNKLKQELDSGVWMRKYGAQLLVNQFDFGYRLVIANKS